MLEAAERLAIRTWPAPSETQAQVAANTSGAASIRVASAGRSGHHGGHDPRLGHRIGRGAGSPHPDRTHSRYRAESREQAVARLAAPLEGDVVQGPTAVAFEYGDLGHVGTEDAERPGHTTERARLVGQFDA